MKYNHNDGFVSPRKSIMPVVWLVLLFIILVLAYTYSAHGSVFRIEVFAASVLGVVVSALGYIGILNNNERLKNHRHLNQYAYIMDRSDNEICTIDVSEMRISHFNKGMQEALGYTPDEMDGLLYEKICVLPESSILKEMISESIESGSSSFSFHAIYRSKDGADRHMDVSAYVPEGDKSVVFCIARDITESRIAMRCIAESEERYRVLVENAAESIVVLNPESGAFMDANNRALDLFDSSIDSILRKTIYEFSACNHSEGASYSTSLRLMMHEASLGSYPVFEWTLVDHYGSEIACEIRLAPLTIDGRRYVRGTIYDITDRKRVEADMLKLSERFKLLLESTGDGIFGVDSSGACTLINKSAADMLGLSQSEIIGRSMHAFVDDMCGSHEMAGSLENSVLYDAYRNGAACKSNSSKFRNNWGDCFSVEYSVYPVMDSGSIGGAVVVFRDIEDRQRMEKHVAYLSRHDPLTGLFNRKEFERRLGMAVDDAKHGDAQHALCYIDVDQFKLVNDVFGHIAGDHLVKQLASAMSSKMRSSDTLARLGGDEFGVLLENCDTEDAMRISHEIKDAVRKIKCSWHDKSFEATVSIGVVPITSGVDAVSDLLRFADAACYIAKENGRNRVRLYSADDAVVAQHRDEMEWVHRIMDAFKEDRFYLAAQKILPITCGDESKVHFEILIRMTDGNGKGVPPMSFIPAAERYNVMPTIDRWVVEKALQSLKDYTDERLVSCASCPEVSLAINISGMSIGDEGFCDFVIEKISEYGIPGDLLIFEVTETSAISNITSAIMFIESLKSLGCKFALDDFGSGMSSFGYLKTLPVDYLKIDGSFVKDMMNDAVDSAMVDAINNIGHVMNIETIAEFVENEEILDRLKEIGVDFGQGYGIAKPEPLDKVLGELLLNQ